MMKYNRPIVPAAKKEVEKEREEAKRRILEENPHIPKDALEFMLSLSVERKIHTNDQLTLMMKHI